jgi:hypothetical protein
VRVGLLYLTISMHMESGLKRRMAIGGIGLIRGDHCTLYLVMCVVSFGEGGIIREYYCTLYLVMYMVYFVRVAL